MQTAEALKRRINTAEDLATVVRTMKTLAAVNIRQYEAAVESLNDYQQTIETAVRMLVWNEPDYQWEQKPVALHRVGLIAFGSDQGMCGGFNDAMSRLVAAERERLYREQAEVRVLILGRRLAERLGDADSIEEPGIDLPGSVSGITPMLLELLPHIDRWRQQHVAQSVILCHHRREIKTSYEPVTRRLLPVSPQRFLTQPAARWPGPSLPLITMPPAQLWQSIVRQFLFVSLFQACAESQASENAARITAMQAAETHINERLGELQLDYQQLRQSSITQELLDVITGFEAQTAVSSTAPDD